MQGASRESMAAARESLDAVVTSDATDLAVVADQLFAVADLLDRESSLRRVLSDPSTDGERRAALAEQVVGSQLDARVLELVRRVVRSRWMRSRDLVDALELLAVHALFTIAERDGTLDDIEDELFRFGRLLEREPTLLMTLTDPAASDERKGGLVRELLEARVTAATLRLVSELVAHPRGRTLERGLDEYARLAADQRDRLVAHVRAAVPLSEEQQTRLASALRAELGRAVDVNVELDPDVVGGMSVRVGEVVYDGTVARRLADARRRLAG